MIDVEGDGEEPEKDSEPKQADKEKESKTEEPKKAEVVKEETKTPAKQAERRGRPAKPKNTLGEQLSLF